MRQAYPPMRSSRNLRSSMRKSPPAKACNTVVRKWHSAFGSASVAGIETVPAPTDRQRQPRERDRAESTEQLSPDRCPPYLVRFGPAHRRPKFVTGVSSSPTKPATNVPAAIARSSDTTSKRPHQDAFFVGYCLSPRFTLVIRGPERICVFHCQRSAQSCWDNVVRLDPLQTFSCAATLRSKLLRRVCIPFWQSADQPGSGATQSSRFALKSDATLGSQSAF